MAKKQKKVSPEDLKKRLAFFEKAAAQGKLYVDASFNEISEEEVSLHVKEYVSQVDELATSKWRSKIAALWQKIISDPDFLQMLMPTPKARKCRDFNKYAVMRIMGILIAHNVYPEESKQTVFCNALERSEKPDNSYRSYLGQGIEDRELRKRLVEYIEQVGGIAKSPNENAPNYRMNLRQITE